MKNTSKNENTLNLMAFVALVIVAVLIVVNKLLPIIGIETKGLFFNALETVQLLLSVIVIGISAYNFVANKSKTWKIIYWISIALFIASIILLWF